MCGSVSGDLLKLVQNVPIYIHNRGRSNRMISDTRYYSGSDFIGYIDYLKKKSSVKFALKMIFDKSYFNSLEGQCLNNHDKCVEWVLDYCDRSDYGYLRPEKIKTL